MERERLDRASLSGIWFHPGPASRAKPRLVIDPSHAEVVWTRTAKSGPVLWRWETWLSWVARHSATPAVTQKAEGPSAAGSTTTGHEMAGYRHQASLACR